ncbi:carbon-nitrogen family hydrolase [Sporolactobacillus pectinivorans]|uniref:carbon-nitrogen family hydrolase n=1 Tax=Sporolactobacillus pectinivorans TaxID=1591408 RepID=UPI000C269906|nr:carbon-nitrogen family hydrolase [Sporolactobacillus pectinivorans]
MKMVLMQLDIAFGEPEKNIRHAEKLMRETLREKTDVMILPELWTTGYDLKNLDHTADAEGEKIKKIAGAWARNMNANVIAGSIAQKTESGIFNTLFVFNREGTRIKEYSKAHLFRLMNEEKFLEAGKQDGLFMIDDIPAAGFVCYDIRFPEWIRKHVLSGARLLFIPAEWPKPRLDHWRTLLTCRAIENQAYVIACNRAGSDPDNVFAGHSMVISPWGEILAEAGEEETVLTVDIDLSAVDTIRSRIPIFEDRRPELY